MRTNFGSDPDRERTAGPVVAVVRRIVALVRRLAGLTRRIVAVPGKQLRRCRTVVHGFHGYVARKGGLRPAGVAAGRRLTAVARTSGVRSAVPEIAAALRMSARFRHAESCDDVPPWANRLTAEESRAAAAQCESLPLVSLVLVVDSVRCGCLAETLDSVAGQHYPNWELILIDRTGDAAVGELIARRARSDRRVRPRLVHHPLAAPLAANVGIDLARGRFVGFVRQGDRLTEDALTWVVWEHNRRPDAVWFYSDHAVLPGDDGEAAAYLKPDYSAEHLLATFYTGDLSVYCRDLVRRSGDFRERADGAHGHDLALRLSETVEPARVVHVPRVLCLRRADAEDADAAGGEAGRRAVADALARRGVSGEVAPHDDCPTLYRLTLRPKRFPKVALFVSTKNAVDLVRQCVASLRAKTRYPNYEIVVINNRSDEPELFRYLDEATAAGWLRVFDYDRPFNHSEMHNEAVAACDAELIVFVNNDIEVLSDGWLEQMVATVDLDESVAGVGALLFYPDGSVQHGGILMGLWGGAGHAHRGLPPGGTGYNRRLEALQEYSGCTAALLLLRRTAFDAVGGFNGVDFPTSFNDVDLWLRLRQAGYRCLYDPAVRATHYESKTRPLVAAKEVAFVQRLREQWAAELECDPFHNPNLCRDNELFRGYRPAPRPAVPPRRSRWRPRAA